MSNEVKTHAEIAATGGKKTLATYGKEHFSKMAKKSRKNVLKNDPDYYKKLSQKGVAARLKKKAEREKEKENESSVNRITNLLTGR